MHYSEITANPSWGKGWQQYRALAQSLALCLSLFLFLFLHNYSVGPVYVPLMPLPLSLITQVNNNLQLQGFPLHFPQG